MQLAAGLVEGGQEVDELLLQRQMQEDVEALSGDESEASGIDGRALSSVRAMRPTVSSACGDEGFGRDVGLDQEAVHVDDKRQRLGSRRVGVVVLPHPVERRAAHPEGPSLAVPTGC